jgi:hypothetical protein
MNIKEIIMIFKRIKEKIGEIFFRIYDYGIMDFSQIMYNIRNHFYERAEKNPNTWINSKLYKLFTAIDYDVTSKLFDLCLDIHIHLIYGKERL